MNFAAIDFLKENNIEFVQNEPMRNHTTFKIGGRAAVVAFPDTVNKILLLIKFLNSQNIPYYVIGNGSNLLITDKDIDIIFIKTEKLSGIQVYENFITVDSGCLNTRVANEALKYSLTGLEFAHGIPGSIGGAVFMNAGAYGENMQNIVCKTDYVNSDGVLGTVSGDEHDFSYRHSVFSAGDVILRTTLKLSCGNTNDIKKKMHELMEKRRNMQPLEYPSAGSVFKRPEGYFAGKLIEDSGLKGFRIGGAEVSRKHSGFIVNTGGATFEDVINLIEHIRETVFKKYNVLLEQEIKIVE